MESHVPALKCTTQTMTVSSSRDTSSKIFYRMQDSSCDILCHVNTIGYCPTVERNAKEDKSTRRRHMTLVSRSLPVPTHFMSKSIR
jgi:hypothetical protein